MFEHSLELLEHLEPSSRARVPALSNWEFSRRLRQLDYLLHQARTRAAQAGASNFDEAVIEQAITYAECFYLVAWRVGVALSQNGSPLGAFNPKGVREVRNWLIEHPENHAASPPLPSWAIGAGGDIRLSLGGRWKPADTPEWSFRDRGLLANAEEFRTDLETLLSRHCSRR